MERDFSGTYNKIYRKRRAGYSLFEKHLDAQLSAGIDGIIIGGSLGESSTLTLSEKERLVKAATAKLDQKIPVILNIAEGSTAEALKQAACAKSWGADGLMVLPPMKYKADDRETVTYFKTIAKSTDLPIMIYNNPFAGLIPSRSNSYVWAPMVG